MTRLTVILCHPDQPNLINQEEIPNNKQIKTLMKFKKLKN